MYSAWLQGEFLYDFWKVNSFLERQNEFCLKENKLIMKKNSYQSSGSKANWPDSSCASLIKYNKYYQTIYLGPTQLKGKDFWNGTF